MIAFHPTGGGAKGLSETDDLAPGTGTGTGTGGTVGIASEVGVRRLTPTECERLQGFDDGWTQLGETPDSRRYSALGDAVTVNVSEWIGRRLEPREV
jgi:DNA (cytosine-5)-methyltransferase 1